ncbi:MAG: hypothetical protein COW73_04960 [Nitrospirae bacterium CG18_big_fil_WC_8_21_14_2_50_70_55]|nr:hypothetical protein [Deltaproteobacteria bacterium]OIP65256.1 MAG: hypothetical protein AUK30_04925 [Nitrospirae bacterium CG2_30_70_394]PIQ05682.1 MAG: hypothetical protein COW73_04960 [Nitrospirae bacterium CG18_big_fil_WC_8_21_14_2_50_70_55]PIW83707.1 MAG: hypothetical protein COZ96_01965 [Nitrospirae bacterium CG_4_8_14_3_um_filter_70_85]PIX84297.1 MAG: hypothetical protein COZ33_01000 [Nitrospirae bacterium CG_4_10_14_3_um_filter_70_108]PJB96564.1 MAG: hypothetical protein CO080_02740
MTLAFDPRAARQALADLPELAAQENLIPPGLARVYIPTQHLKVLHLDASVVVGMRGAGKSWWTAVLANDKHRGFVSEQLGGSSLARVTARVGFGLDDTEADFPRPETLGALVDQGLDPVDIWHTVVLRHVLRAVERPVPFSDCEWKTAVAWFIEHGDEANRLLTECDAQLAADGRVLLVLFDAFDRLATDWEKVRRLTSGALQLGLRLRSRRSIRTKFFIRPDLEEDDEVWHFPDSSKLRHAKVDLAWSSADLYGLVFMHLGNARDFGPRFREATGRVSGAEWREREGVHVSPPQISGEEVQRSIVEALADRTMGGGPKRGYTYSWVPLHLADAKGRISPRSYLLAFKRAAEHTAERWPDHGLALHYTAIQQGVVKASQVRVDEIGEDYPWVKPLLEAARGAEVPMTTTELSSRWPADSLGQVTKAAGDKLPPRRFTNDPFRQGSPEALIDDLVELAVLYRTKDGRLNMPDIFRVGFGIRRRGGVKPPRRT